MSRHQEESRLTALLSNLPREAASDDFTQDVMARVRLSDLRAEPSSHDSHASESAGGVDDPLAQALRTLPTQVARPGFKTAVMARVSEPVSKPRRALTAIAHLLLGDHPARTAPVLVMALLVATGLGAWWSDLSAPGGVYQGGEAAVAAGTSGDTDPAPPTTPQ